MKTDVKPELPLEEQILDLQTRIKQLKALKQKVAARKKIADIETKRSNDTKTKVLIGAAILSRVALKTWPLDSLNSMMDKFLTRPSERALFGFDPHPDHPVELPEESNETKPKTPKAPKGEIKQSADLTTQPDPAPIPATPKAES